MMGMNKTLKGFEIGTPPVLWVVFFLCAGLQLDLRAVFSP